MAKINIERPKNCEVKKIRGSYYLVVSGNVNTVEINIGRTLSFAYNILDTLAIAIGIENGD
jgi:hypothetical protein